MLKKIKEFFIKEILSAISSVECSRAVADGNLSGRLKCIDGRLKCVEAAMLELNTQVKKATERCDGDPFNQPKKELLCAEKFTGDFVRRVFIDKRNGELGIKILARTPIDVETFNAQAMSDIVERALRELQKKGNANEA